MNVRKMVEREICRNGQAKVVPIPKDKRPNAKGILELDRVIAAHVRMNDAQLFVYKNWRCGI